MTEKNSAMRIAVLGNSHVACVKAALDADPSLADGTEIIFYAAIAELMRDFRRVGDRLEPVSDRLRDKITSTASGEPVLEPGQVDAVVLIAMSFRMHPIPDARLSDAVLRRDTLGRLTGGYGWQLATEAAALLQVPVHVTHMPLPALDRDVFMRNNSATPIRYDRLADYWREGLGGAGLGFLEQPETTRYEDVMTRRSLARGPPGWPMGRRMAKPSGCT